MVLCLSSLIPHGEGARFRVRVRDRVSPVLKSTTKQDSDQPQNPPSAAFPLSLAVPLFGAVREGGCKSFIETDRHCQPWEIREELADNAVLLY